MSVWRITKYEPVLERDWTVVAVLPDELPEDGTPVEMALLVAEPGREADALIRRYPLERTLCRERGVAALCVPGWAADCPQAEALFNEALPRWLEALFPVRVAPGAVHTLPVGVL